MPIDYAVNMFAFARGRLTLRKGGPGCLGATLFRRLNDAFMAKDLDAALAMFADDAILIDPRYPEPRRAAAPPFERGMRWGLASLD
jgi:hypothetical protein